MSRRAQSVERGEGTDFMSAIGSTSWYGARPAIEKRKSSEHAFGHCG